MSQYYCNALECDNYQHHGNVCPDAEIVGN